MKLGFALSIAVLASSASFAQTIENVVLNTVTIGPTGAYCLPIPVTGGETVNGVPIDLSAGVGESMEICPDYYNNSADNGEIFAQVPSQPWASGLGWYQWYIPTALITRYEPVQVSGESFVETDTFANYVKTYDDFGVHTDTWNGYLTRNLLRHEKCGRWPCHVPPAQCLPTNGCHFYFTEVDDTLHLTGSLVVN